jgi:hypothetical protein
VNPGKSFLKAILFAFVAGWLLFFLGVFLGLVVLGIIGVVQGQRPDFTWAYKFVGAPLAILGMLATFVGSIIRDFRRAPHNSD